jgi:hypothetical protein
MVLTKGFPMRRKKERAPQKKELFVEEKEMEGLQLKKGREADPGQSRGKGLQGELRLRLPEVAGRAASPLHSPVSGFIWG